MLRLVGACTVARRSPKFGKIGRCVRHRMRVVGLLRAGVRLMLRLVGARTVARRSPSSARSAAAFATECGLLVC